MAMEIEIGRIIKKKRADRGISQEVLAEYIGVSVQAVSKWETGMSMPDISILPKLAEYFGISMDELFFGVQTKFLPFPDDNILRVVQYRGKNMVDYKEISGDNRIMLKTGLSHCCNVEVYGSADIEGDINGNVRALANVKCDDINGNVTVGAGLLCGDIEGNVSAGHNVSCADVYGSVSAGAFVSCGNVSGDASGDIRNGILRSGDKEDEIN